MLLLAIAVAARARTFGNPVIGFDEQFYLLVGDRLLHDGALPFVGIFDRKPIGLFLIYALARSLGGAGFLEYKLVALAFVVGTACIIHRIARRGVGPAAALIAGAFYILWLDFMEGEGGQAPVFYNLPMVAAAGIIHADVQRGNSPRATGAWAMALVGLAIQIKYSVIFEGIYFGCWLIAGAWRLGERGVALAASIAMWVACALLPTMVALLVYAALGHAQDFVFANSLSVFAQGRSAASDQLGGAATMLGILAIPLSFIVLGWRGRTRMADDERSTSFLLGWLSAATAAVIIYWRFPSPQYAMPLLLPTACLLAPVLDSGTRRRMGGIALAVSGFVGGQIVLGLAEARKGGAQEAVLVARAAAPGGAGCIYVYDGYPALYMLTHSCLPTRWPFPGHLNTAEEAHPAALGVDPAAEVHRIMATRPAAVVDDFPRFAGGNPVTHRVLQHALDADYALAACVRTGPERVRLVYRRKREAIPHPADCPTGAALRRGR